MTYEKELDKYIAERREDVVGRRVIPSPKGGESATIERTFTEGVNYAYRINEQIRNCQFALLNRRFGYEMFQASVVMLFNMIPETWKDRQFVKDMKKAYLIVEVNPTAHKLSARIDATLATVSNAKYIKKKTQTKVANHFSIFRCCVNLLDRRGVLFTENVSEVIW